MVVSFSQQFATIFKKNVKNAIRTRSFLKEVIALCIIAGLSIALKYGGGSSTSYIPAYMPLAILLFCRGAVQNWVGQKQFKQVEIQKIMGASFSAYLLSWTCFFIVNGILLSIIYIGILGAAGVFNDETVSIFQMLGLYFLMMFATFSYCMMLSSFFSSAQMAAQVITFIQLLGIGFYFLLNVQNFRNSKLGMQVVALIPSACFQYTTLSMGLGINSNLPTSFTTKQGFITLGCQAIIYFLIFIYLQMVIPNDNGTHYHPLFFIKKLFQSKSSKEISQKFQLSELTSARFFQQSHQKKDITLMVKDLEKSFGKKKVVNGIGLALFKKQVFCLLGHNGAGKSTTINMLTGILNPDKGIINMLGLDYYHDLQTIRTKIGVCLQIDVLYDELTVREHLQFYADLKGIPKSLQNQKINQIIQKCCLSSQQQKKSNTLSGGNKRKLCLACAAIGNSQLLFLDQPSSGLDPNTRRHIWSLIQQLRQQGRTIVLTTHHLEQAQALSDRIGILANGELIILGSCHYIKQKFSVGYNLNISLKNEIKKTIEEKKQQIRTELKNIIGNYRQDDQMAQQELKILLPTSKQKDYAQLFNHLEEKKYEFSLTMSTLQDIFVRIGMDPQSVLNNAPLPDIQKIELPIYSPHYNFFNQFSAVFVKKMKTTMRSFSVVVSIIMPLVYISIGAVVSMISYNDPSSQKQKYIFLWSQFYTLAYFMTIAYSFNSSSFCGSIVAERQKKFKYLSFVMGMKKIPYWLGTMAFDMILFWIPSIALLIVIACFPSSQSNVFVSKFGYIILILFAFSLSFLPFTYLWTHAFQRSQTAYRFYPIFIMIVFAIAPQIPIYIIPSNTALKYILPIVSPLLGLVNAMLTEQVLGQQAYNYYDQNSNIFTLYLTPTLWYQIGILLAQGIIYLTLTIIIDNIKFRLNDNQNLEVEDMEIKKSDDLIKEQNKILKSQDQLSVVVNRLYKKYPNGYLAIKDNSFGVAPGQTFGLLGPNGAGKSTTFNILTAAQPKTQGSVKLLNTEVNRSVMEIFNDVGVCPQFNPIYQNLTVYQHLIFFGKLKGLQGDQLQKIVQFYLNNLQLAQYKNQKTQQLSGGNKRKLCVCISLIGNPTLLFLDEPSAGVDAISRRYLWNILSSSARQTKRSIVLTTHSIHEAQSLCNRIGILIKGQFICIDTPSQLKKRYGKGYRINVKCQKQQQIEKVKAQMKKIYGNIQYQQIKQAFKVSFQISRAGFKFSQAFKLFYNQLYLNNVVKQYQIAQNSLEEVFIYLSKLQPQPQHIDQKKIGWKFCCWQKSQKGCFCLC